MGLRSRLKRLRLPAWSSRCFSGCWSLSRLHCPVFWAASFRNGFLLIFANASAKTQPDQPEKRRTSGTKAPCSSSTFGTAKAVPLTKLSAFGTDSTSLRQAQSLALNKNFQTDPLPRLCADLSTSTPHDSVEERHDYVSST